MTGFVLFAHGSRVESANDSVRRLMREFASGESRPVRCAFLELGAPDLAGAVSDLAAEGVDHIVVIPYFLTLGTHLQRDLPRMVEDLRRLYSGIGIQVTEPLDGHPALLSAVLDRAKDALHGGGRSESQTG